MSQHTPPPPLLIACGGCLELRMCQSWLWLKCIAMNDFILHQVLKRNHQKALIRLIICAICLPFSFYEERLKTKRAVDSGGLHCACYWLCRRNAAEPCCDDEPSHVFPNNARSISISSPVAVCFPLVLDVECICCSCDSISGNVILL